VILPENAAAPFPNFAKSGERGGEKERMKPHAASRHFGRHRHRLAPAVDRGDFVGSN